jgi:hypothetical protein
MNVAFDFRYVTPGAYHAFDDVKPSLAVSAAELAKLDPNARGRAAAFAPGGPYATMMAERPIVMRVGDTLFVHGGVLPKHARRGLDTLNDEAREWLLGKSRQAPSALTEQDSPAWSRLYSDDNGANACKTLEEALALTGAKRMVMGHTVQKNGINATCDERAWRIDTGLAKFYGGKLEVLEIRGDAVKVKRPD